MAAAFNIKTNRTFTLIRKRAWLITLLVAIGGLWYPKLGLLVIPIILSLTGLAFFRGRQWCGNFCPHGSLYDYLALPLSLNKKIPSFFKSKGVLGLVLAWFGYSMTNKLLKTLPTLGTESFLDKLGFVFVTTYLMVLIVGGFLSIFIAPRTWCQFCPMGTLQMLSYKLGKLLGVAKVTDQKITIAAKEKCHNCGKCSRVCPMQLAPYQEFSGKNQFDNEKCIKCSTCVVNCPAKILSLNTEEKAAQLIQITDIDGYDKRVKISAVLTKITKLKEDVTEYTFDFKTPPRVDYKAGQFILVKVQDNPRMSRAYSISSYNKDGRSLSVTVKTMTDGYGTGLIAGFKVGDKVELDGPMGKELVVDKSVKKVLLVAGGIGITPFRSIVTELLNSPNKIEEIKLIYGVNKQQEFIFDEDFKKMEYEHKTFEFIKVVAADDTWEGKKGFVTNVIQEMDLDDYKVYICGPKPMIGPAMKVLNQRNVNEENIFVESA
ncbi:FAD-binding oxidoreductase [Desulfosporosinus sp.]|uniref:FAD-binding oxidoreductase n=1 Tax=Desulfosporosinus sp. TaxID=157907 RepID=UPI0025BAA427|nr:FAD-binding oxidoreductase [Desulfosporosinus sp.]MBC2727199.1 4Fe-4S binding protein [Desulfosporosinus sp.]